MGNRNSAKNIRKKREEIAEKESKIEQEYDITNIEDFKDIEEDVKEIIRQMGSFYSRKLNISSQFIEKKEYLEYDEHINKNNDLLKLIELYPDKPWNYYYFSQNPNITWEIVRDNPDKPWNLYLSFSKSKYYMGNSKR
jgi:4-amino-4-deoxy-L-arabinose transferase-like glycosyltransferase